MAQPGLLHTHRPWAIGLAALLLLESPPVLEAQERDRRAGKIEEVVVTARRVEESLQDTPVSVTAFGTDALEQIGVSEPQDMAKYAPNVTIRKQTSTNNDYAISIRGVAEAEPALAIDPAVGLYIDGVYIARNGGAAFDIVDLERIEVLRGPQGTLFGRNTIGGAVNIITQKPSGGFGYVIEAGAGDEGRERGKLTVDTPAMGDLAAKLTFFHTDREGEVRSIYDGRKLGGQQTQALRLALRWTPSLNWTVDYNYTRTEGAGNGNQVQMTHLRPIFADPNGQFYGGPYYELADEFDSQERRSQLPQVNSDPDLTEITLDGHALHLEWLATENLTIRSITGYREFEDFTISEFNQFRVPNDGDVIDGRQLETQGTVGVIPAGTFVPLFSAPRDRQQEQITQEFQFIGNYLNGALQFTSGLYYFEEEGFEDNPQEFVLPTSLIVNFAGTDSGLPQDLADILSGATTAGEPSATLLARPFQDGIENKAYAAYGNVTWIPFTDFEITLGARYTVDERLTTIRNIFGGEVQNFEAEDDWSNFSPEITFRYRFSPEVSAYLKLANGYRSGGFNVRATTESSFKTPFDPEELTSLELGFKTDLFDRSLRLNGAIFRFEYEDRQIAQFEAGSGGASSKIVNAGKSTTTGLEIDAIWVPAPGTRVIAGYGFMDVEFNEFITGPVDPVTGFPTGPNRDISDIASPDRYAPENTASLAVEHTLAPWDFGQLTLRLDATYTDRITFHPQFTLFDDSAAHKTVNARVTLADIALGDGLFQMAAWGKNLTNEEYRDFGIDFGLLGFTVNTYAPLRSWGVDFKYSFNR